MQHLRSFITYCLILFIILSWRQQSLANATNLPASGEFTDIGANLGPGDCAAIAWGDYDSDGDLDALIARGNATNIYRNDKGIFTVLNVGLPAIQGYCYGSVDWGDYDNDNDLDILLSGNSALVPITKVYRNDNGVFTDTNAGLVGINSGMAKWGDFDNNGKLDIALAGEAPNWTAKIYRNSNGKFIDIGAQLFDVANSSLDWGDYDNDGYLDLVISGHSYEHQTMIYHNDHGKFSRTNFDILPIEGGSVAWGDYDNNGYLDLLLNGQINSTYILIYRNDGSEFTPNFIAEHGTVRGTATWGDYDNDGKLDIALVGDTILYPPREMKIFHNKGDDHFEDIAADFPGIHFGSARWGDYNNDGKLDILVAGNTDYSNIARIYHNNTSSINTIPNPPTGLITAASAFQAMLQWNASSDNETPQSGLTYNVRIGTTPGGTDILSAMSNLDDGTRMLPQSGNAGHRTNMVIRGLTPDTIYYWSVQAVDTTYTGSPFASEASFKTYKATFFPVILK